MSLYHCFGSRHFAESGSVFTESGSNPNSDPVPVQDILWKKNFFQKHHILYSIVCLLKPLQSSSKDIQASGEAPARERTLQTWTWNFLVFSYFGENFGVPASGSKLQSESANPFDSGSNPDLDTKHFLVQYFTSLLTSFNCLCRFRFFSPRLSPPPQTPKFDMVWLYRSPIPVRRRGVISSF